MDYKGVIMADVKTGRKWHKQNRAPKPYAEDRQAMVAQLYIDLDEWEKNEVPEVIAELVARHSDGYHGRNPKLIAMQDRLATDVDAHGAWKERGRRVVGKGTGIKIIYPSTRWTEPNPNDPAKPIEHTSYAMRYVFDIRHTVPDTPEAIQAWNEDHPKDEETGNRTWDEGDDYTKYNS
jgi:hypothetical protein